MSNLADIKVRAEAVKHLNTPLPDGHSVILTSDAEKALAQLIIELVDALEPLMTHNHSVGRLPGEHGELYTTTPLET